MVDSSSLGQGLQNGQKCVTFKGKRPTPVVTLNKMETALRAEIEALRSDKKKMETALRAEIEVLRVEVEALRNDMEKLEARLNGKIDVLSDDMKNMEANLRAEFQAEMRALEHRLTIKLGSLLALSLGLMTLIIRLFGATP